MTKSLNTLLKEFSDWLIFRGKKSTNYSKINVPQALKQILVPWFNYNFSCDPFDSFNQNSSNSKKRAYIISLSEVLFNEEIKKNSCGLTVKTIKDYRSGTREFFLFMETEGYFFNCSINISSLRSALNKIGGSIQFKRKDLFETFESRLITQDRAYSNMIYPARLLNIIFNNSPKKDAYKKTIEAVLNKTKFLIDGKGCFLRLSGIDSVELSTSRNVSVSAKSKTYSLYTETGTKGQYILLTADCLDDLSLDHEPPLQNILDNLKAQTDYPALKQLSDMYVSFVIGKTCKGNYLSINPSAVRNFVYNSGRCYNAIRHLLSVRFIDDLFSDLDKLFKEFEFTVMQRNLNSSKGKGKKPTKKSTKSKSSAAVQTKGTCKIGELARTVLRAILESGKASKAEIKDMLTFNYSNATFGLQYPLLVKNGSTFDAKRYYVKPLTIYNEVYYLCSQWFETTANNDRPLLEKWIKNHP